VTRSGHRTRLSLALALAAGCAGGYQGVKDGGLTPYPALDQSALDDAHKPRRVALLFGIDRFDDTAWRPLRYAGRDARDLGAVLLDPSIGAFDQVDVRTAPEETSRVEIRQAFDQLADRVGDPRDTVVVYLSTHGTLARGPSGEVASYLVARDSRLQDVGGSALPMAEIRQRFAELRSKRKVLILATCHSGQGKSALPTALQKELEGIKGGSFFVPPLASVSQASVILSVCSWGETAREDERLAHDIYTHFFLEALKNGLDRNGDGAVTVSEAHEHALIGTYGFTAGRQRPTARSDILGEDPIVLAGRRSRPGRPALIGYGEGWRDVRVLVNGTEKGTLPGSVLLEVGSHDVDLVHAGASEPFAGGTVDLVPGQRLDLISLVDVASANGPEIGVSMGGQGFLSSEARTELYGAATLFRVEAAWPGLIADGWTASADAGIGRHLGSVEPVEGVRVLAVHQTLVGGLGVYKDLLFGRALLRAGPRIEALSLSRELSGDSGFEADDGVFSFGVGAAAGIGYPLGGGFWAVLDARLSVVYLRVDNETLNLTNGAAFGGLRYRL
jgi:hypothetical protein